MLEQTAESSRLSANFQKLWVDLREETSVVGCMDNDERFDTIKVRGALFSLITARLEDAHEIAVKGQSSKTHQKLISQLTSDLVVKLEESRILLNASDVTPNLHPFAIRVWAALLHCTTIMRKRTSEPTTETSLALTNL
jgi:hypothetical protein